MPMGDFCQASNTLGLLQLHDEEFTFAHPQLFTEDRGRSWSEGVRACLIKGKAAAKKKLRCGPYLVIELSLEETSNDR